MEQLAIAATHLPEVVSLTSVEAVQSTHALVKERNLPVLHLTQDEAASAEQMRQSASAHATHSKCPGIVVISFWNVPSGQLASQVFAIVSLNDLSQRVQVVAAVHSRQFDEQDVHAAPDKVPYGQSLTQI